MPPTSGIASIAYGGAYYNLHANRYNNVIYLYDNELDLIDRVLDDMKDYKSTLKAFDATVTINAILNRLGEIAIETEDKQLKTMLENIAGRLRALHAKGTEKIRLAGIPQNHHLSGDISKVVAVVTAYCRKCIDARETQWQILARQAGWTPPT